MHANRFAEETSLSPDSTQLASSPRAVVAYHDVAAGRRAMRVLSDLAKGVGDGLEFQPLLWSFELLADEDWRDVADSDVAIAEILIIATSSPNPLPPEVGRWAEAVISKKQGTDAAIVALFGPEENPDGAESTRLEAIRTAADRAGLDFFAPTPRLGIAAAPPHLHPHSALVTPVLEAMLRHHEPAPRPEFNS